MKYVIPILVVAAGVRIWLRMRSRAKRRAGGAPGGAAPGASGGVGGALATSPAARLVARVLDATGDVGLVARREVRERLRTRLFRISTLIVLLAVAAAVIIPVLTKGSTTPTRVGVVGTLSGPLRATVRITGAEVGGKVTVVPEASQAAAERALRAGRLDVALVDSRRLVVEKSLSPTDTSTTAEVVRALSETVALQAGLQGAGIPPLEAAELAHPRPLPIEALVAAPSKTKTTERTTETFGLIFTYVLLSQYGTWLIMGVIEEKSSRVAEVLLSTLRPRQLLAGKVIGIGTVAMLQAALIVAVALGLGAAVGSSLIHGAAPLALVASLVWVFLGYAFYCWVFAAGGSMADRQDQVQALAFPLMLPILFAYIYSLIELGAGSPSLLIKVLAYLPPTAPFAMPTLVGLGVATWWEFAISVGLSLVGIVLVARLASSIYYRAILRTGGRVHLRDVLRTELAPTVR
ncbi:MAG TPA: ABC transporter permease [Acidimicrobiales bacterium]|nr:ABC transporter permease [Acidimicrobiales bacterium]